mmetsp:Transcript_26228/g.68894  ORF Transcript_26228/g.68894 Transcript_26228/m.68894 type:complete len:445 (+) Transcript_26228:315-1649(+)
MAAPDVGPGGKARDGSAGRGRLRAGSARPMNSSSASDFLAHTAELVDPTVTVQHGTTNGYGSYRGDAYYGRSRGCAHYDHGKVLYLDKPPTEKSAPAGPAKIRRGDLHREMHQQGPYLPPVGKATGDFYSGAHSVDSRKEKRGEPRPLGERFSDPDEYARAQHRREMENARFRQQQVSQIEERAAARVERRRASARERARFMLDEPEGVVTPERESRSKDILDRYHRRKGPQGKGREVGDDPFRSVQGKRERRSVVLLEPVVGGAGGATYHDRWYKSNDRRPKGVADATVAAELEDKPAAYGKSVGVDRTLFQPPPGEVPEASQSIVDLRLRKDGNIYNNHPMRDGAGGPHARRVYQVTQGRHFEDRAVAEEQWINAGLGRNATQPRPRGSIEESIQRSEEAMPRMAHEDRYPEADRRRDPRSKGRYVNGRNAEFNQLRSGPRW